MEGREENEKGERENIAKMFNEMAKLLFAV
jgi:hypothetical protein